MIFLDRKMRPSRIGGYSGRSSESAGVPGLISSGYRWPPRASSGCFQWSGSWQDTRARMPSTDPFTGSGVSKTQHRLTFHHLRKKIFRSIPKNISPSHTPPIWIATFTPAYLANYLSIHVHHLRGCQGDLEAQKKPPSGLRPHLPSGNRTYSRVVL